MSTTSIRVWCNWRSASSPVISQQFALHVVLQKMPWKPHDLTTWKVPWYNDPTYWLNDDPSRNSTPQTYDLHHLFLYKTAYIIFSCFFFSSSFVILQKKRVWVSVPCPPTPSVKSTSKSSSQPAKAGSHAWIIWSSATNSAQDGSLGSLSQGFWQVFLKESLSSCANL